MNKRLLDPAHVFDYAGKSILSMEGLIRQVEELTVENERLKSMNHTLARRLTAVMNEPDELDGLVHQEDDEPL